MPDMADGVRPPAVLTTQKLPPGYISGTPAAGTPTGHRSLGVAACTAIVVGNMVGSGFYLSPRRLPPTESWPSCPGS